MDFGVRVQPHPTSSHRRQYYSNIALGTGTVLHEVNIHGKTTPRLIRAGSCALTTQQPLPEESVYANVLGSATNLWEKQDVREWPLHELVHMLVAQQPQYLVVGVWNGQSDKPSEKPRENSNRGWLRKELHIDAPYHLDFHYVDDTRNHIPSDLYERMKTMWTFR